MQNSKRIYCLVSPLSERFPWCAGDAHWLLFSHSVMSISLWPHGLQNARLPCPSSSPGACSDSCPLSRWCHPTISSSVTPFSCPQSFPASGSFPVSQLFTTGGQSIGASALASVLPVNIQRWFPLGMTPCSPRNSQNSSPMPQFESINCLVLSLLYGLTLTSARDCWKIIALTIWTLSAKLCLCFFIGYFYSIFTSTFESLKERSKIQWFSRWIFWNAFFLFFLTSALRDLLEISPVCFILEIQMDFM